uniref:Uncharacterized protein n=1 Tax=Eutreptiella gymnastica TaxID=73025 RepID=A0A7S1JB99_9EUGL|mmetsp:Transcript_81607/g.143901  ORF Transcript_81607/g.143901 Transcript_81607/m.143901 type:complete len:104 (+) Transcript_81607:124-435(+)
MNKSGNDGFARRNMGVPRCRNCLKDGSYICSMYASKNVHTHAQMDISDARSAMPERDCFYICSMHARQNVLLHLHVWQKKRNLSCPLDGKIMFCGMPLHSPLA